MAYLLKADNTITEVAPANGATFTLEELQRFVGGYIEIVHTHTGDLLVCNEDGKLKGLPVNEQASERYQFGKYDRVVGDVLIASKRELEPEDEPEEE